MTRDQAMSEICKILLEFEIEFQKEQGKQSLARPAQQAKVKPAPQVKK